MKVMPGKISGEMDAPPSKSMMQRAVAIAALAKGETKIDNPSFCEDSLAAIDIAKALGAEVEIETDRVVIERSENRSISDTLNCHESGLCMRMFSPIAALFDKQVTITGTGTLLSRPVDMVMQLEQLGAKVKTNSGTPPVNIGGPIAGGKIVVDGAVSSQFISGLMIALPLCKNDSTIEITNLKSIGYVSMTEEMVRFFGAEITCDEKFETVKMRGNQNYWGRELSIEGDWSGASFLLVAGAIAGEVNVNKLPSSVQPDQDIKSVLMDVGAELELSADEVFVSKKELNAFEFDATNSPDLFPPLVALACNCNGKSIIRGVGRLIHKESNRAQALVEEFTRIGAKVRISGDQMEIVGGTIRGGRVDSHGDHRIAMACAVAGLRSQDGVEIKNSECVSKSYPKFFQDLERLRA